MILLNEVQMEMTNEPRMFKIIGEMSMPSVSLFGQKYDGVKKTSNAANELIANILNIIPMSIQNNCCERKR